jgi:predicted Zn-dependent protease
VDLKSQGDIPATDTEMLNALRNLRREDPDNPLWAQMLGFIRFKRGGWEVVDAMYQMNEALDGGATNILPYIVSAEASRLLGNTDRAIETLQRGLEKHPDNLAMLNNLAYAASLSPETLPQALSLVPQLRERAQGDVHIFDTIAHIYLRAGQFEKSEAILKQILSSNKKGTAPWFRARMRQADMELRRPEKADSSEMDKALKEAQAILADAFRHSTRIPDEDILTANKLLAEIQTRLQEEDSSKRQHGSNLSLDAGPEPTATDK